MAQQFMLPGTQPEGLARLHHLEGWTALFFWDRSVDSKCNSNSTFLFRGLYTFQEVCDLAYQRFPSIWNRFTVHIRQLTAIED